MVKESTHTFFGAFIGDEEIKVWEEVGQQLFGMSGQQFWDTNRKLDEIETIYQWVFEEFWIVHFVCKKNRKGELLIVALSFNL